MRLSMRLTKTAPPIASAKRPTPAGSRCRAIAVVNRIIPLLVWLSSASRGLRSATRITAGTNVTESASVTSTPMPVKSPKVRIGCMSMATNESSPPTAVSPEAITVGPRYVMTCSMARSRPISFTTA